MGGGLAVSSGERWYIAFFLSKMAGGASAPLVPLFVIVVLGGGITEVTLAVVSVSIATVPAFIVWGEYTDKRGKRRFPMMLGMAMTAVAFLVMAMADGIVFFVLGNALYGFFLAATVPTSTILIMEHNPKGEWGRAVGVFSKVSGFGWMLGIVTGVVFFGVSPAFLDPVLAMRAFMVLCALLSTIAMVLVALWIDEPKTRIDRRWVLDELVSFRTWAFERSRFIPSKLVFVMRPRVIRKARLHVLAWGRSLDNYMVATFIMFTGIQIFYVPFPVMLSQELLLGSAEIFAVYLISALAAAAMYAWAGRQVDRLGNQRSQLLAWGSRTILFSMFTLTLMAIALGLPLIAFAGVMILNGLIGAMFSIVSVAGITSVLDLSPPSVRGEAVGAYNSVTGLGMIVGGVTGGVIAASMGFVAVAIATSLLGLLAMGLLRAVRFPKGETS
jgi:MFS family permease